mgnify:CR=1 FL=1
MQSIMTLSNTILDHVPKPADGWKVFKQTTPRPTEKPPWVIETVTTNGHIVGETQHVHCGIGTLQVRIVSTTTDSVNVLADDLMIPALAGKRFVAQGFDTGCLTLFSDSGAYAAGLTAEDTSLLYQVRLLTSNSTGHACDPKYLRRSHGFDSWNGSSFHTGGRSGQHDLVPSIKNIQKPTAAEITPEPT